MGLVDTRRTHVRQLPFMPKGSQIRNPARSWPNQKLDSTTNPPSTPQSAIRQIQTDAVSCKQHCLGSTQPPDPVLMPRAFHDPVRRWHLLCDSQSVFLRKRRPKICTSCKILADFDAQSRSLATLSSSWMQPVESLPYPMETDLSEPFQYGNFLQSCSRAAEPTLQSIKPSPSFQKPLPTVAADMKSRSSSVSQISPLTPLHVKASSRPHSALAAKMIRSEDRNSSPAMTTIATSHRPHLPHELTKDTLTKGPLYDADKRPCSGSAQSVPLFQRRHSPD